MVKLARKNKTSKKSLKKKSVKNTSPISRQDFEAFKFGVRRLKELRNELESLDTRGFAKEEQRIKNKLKNVSEIPNIEKELKELKLKINNKFSPKKKKKSSTKEIKREISHIHEDIETIKKTRKANRENLEDIKFELKKLRTAHSKSGGMHIDSGVDLLVDTNFNNFLNQTKKALSERIEKKEHQVDDVLKIDLDKREQKYHQKHETLLKDFRRANEKLEKDFENKYNMKVKSSLHKEVAENFNKILREKLAREKVELSKSYKIELKQHADEELEKQKMVLKNSFDKQKGSVASKLEQSKHILQEKLQKEFHDNLVSQIAQKEKELRKNLSNEYELRLKKKIEEHEAEIKKKKLDLELEMQKKIKKILS